MPLQVDWNFQLFQPFIDFRQQVQNFTKRLLREEEPPAQQRCGQEKCEHDTMCEFLEGVVSTGLESSVRVMHQDDAHREINNGRECDAQHIVKCS